MATNRLFKHCLFPAVSLGYLQFHPQTAPMPLAECFVDEGERKRLSKAITEVYVWGDGQQVDSN